MSCDYHVLKLTDEIAYLSEIGPAKIVGLGLWSSVREQVSAIIPGINWMDWGGSLKIIDRWIEFRIAKRRSTADSRFTPLIALTTDWKNTFCNSFAARSIGQ